MRIIDWFYKQYVNIMLFLVTSWIVRDILRYLSISGAFLSALTGLIGILFVLHGIVCPIVGIMKLRKMRDANWLAEVQTALFFLILPPAMVLSFFVDCL